METQTADRHTSPQPGQNAVDVGAIAGEAVSSLWANPAFASRLSELPTLSDQHSTVSISSLTPPARQPRSAGDMYAPGSMPAYAEATGEAREEQRTSETSTIGALGGQQGSMTPRRMHNEPQPPSAPRPLHDSARAEEQDTAAAHQKVDLPDSAKLGKLQSYTNVKSLEVGGFSLGACYCTFVCCCSSGWTMWLEGALLSCVQQHVQQSLRSVQHMFSACLSILLPRRTASLFMCRCLCSESGHFAEAAVWSLTRKGLVDHKPRLRQHWHRYHCLPGCYLLEDIIQQEA
jgi:hypothetical protein